jgi:hypothetical protein
MKGGRDGEKRQKTKRERIKYRQKKTGERKRKKKREERKDVHKTCALF